MPISRSIIMSVMGMPGSLKKRSLRIVSMAPACMKTPGVLLAEVGMAQASSSPVAVIPINTILLSTSEGSKSPLIISP
jgi:hypothetical protein